MSLKNKGLGGRLKELRKQKGLSVAEAARRLKFSPSTYRDWKLCFESMERGNYGKDI